MPRSFICSTAISPVKAPQPLKLQFCGVTSAPLVNLAAQSAGGAARSAACTRAGGGRGGAGKAATGRRSPALGIGQGSGHTVDVERRGADVDLAAGGVALVDVLDEAVELGLGVRVALPCGRSTGSRSGARRSPRVGGHGGARPRRQAPAQPVAAQAGPGMALSRARRTVAADDWSARHLASGGEEPEERGMLKKPKAWSAPKPEIDLVLVWYGPWYLVRCIKELFVLVLVGLVQRGRPRVDGGRSGVGCTKRHIPWSDLDASIVGSADHLVDKAQVQTYDCMRVWKVLCRPALPVPLPSAPLFSAATAG